MKALTTSQFVKLPLEDKIKYHEAIEGGKYRTEPYNDYFTEYLLTNWYTNFITQEFKPEMIEGLFKGWRKSQLYAKGYHSNNDDFTLVFHPNIKHSYTITKNKKAFGYEWIYPDTLKRFISNCQQAGIELEFKSATICSQLKEVTNE